MQEILNKRSYNAKHFEKGDGSFAAEIHAGHIHYKEGEEYKPIDWTLVFDEVKRGWGFNTHSFNPFFPEYSTEFAEFRDRFHDKDQLVRYKPIGTTVKGELIDTDQDNPGFDDNPDNKGVIYRDTFGQGLDYMLYNTRSSMVKVAIINDPKAFTKDAVFEWELEFPDKEIFRVDKKEDAEEMTAKGTKTNTEDGKLVGYRLEKRDGKNLNTNKLTLIGNSKLDGKEWYTYLKFFKAWDSEGNTIEIVARISFVDGKAILKKTIPLEFLQKAVGKVYADTTTSYTMDANYSGSTRNANISGWSNCRDASSGNWADEWTILHVASHCNGTNNYTIYRPHIEFDTSGLSGATVTAADLYLYPESKQDTDNDGNAYINVYSSMKPTQTAIATSDYSKIGSTKLSSDKDITGISTGGWIYFTFNSSGITEINSSGRTVLSMREGHDYADDPVTAAYKYCEVDFTGPTSTNTSRFPYLSVTYEAGTPASTWTPKIIIF